MRKINGKLIRLIQSTAESSHSANSELLKKKSGSDTVENVPSFNVTRVCYYKLYEQKLIKFIYI